MNWLACFEGQNRSGKSYAATLFGAILDKTFLDDLPNRIVHGHQAFIEKVKDIDAKKIYGAAIVCDEAGVVGNFSSAEWQKEWMAAINSVMQMFGYLHLVVLFIAPDKSFIDSKTRRMFHTIHRVSRADNDYSTVKPHQLRWNQMKKKWDEVNPIIRIGNIRIKMKHMRIRHYPKDLGARYQALEQERKPAMLQNLGQRATASQVQQARRTFDNEALAEVVYKDIIEHTTEKSKYETKRSKPENRTVDAVMVKVSLGLPMDNARYVKSLVETRLEKEKIKVQP
jgi:hypothetical protein